MDTNKLRTLVFEKTGIRIDTGDPVFALVALNEAVLAESIGSQVDALRQAADALRDQAAALTAAGDRYQGALQALGAAGPEGAAALVQAQRKESGRFTPMPANWLLGAFGVALLSAVLTIAGTRLFSTEPAAPAGGQIALLQNGEQFARAWQQLDAPAKEKIRQLVAKP
jgi:hypothetical protein